MKRTTAIKLGLALAVVLAYQNCSPGDFEAGQPPGGLEWGSKVVGSTNGVHTIEFGAHVFSVQGVGEPTGVKLDLVSGQMEHVNGSLTSNCALNGSDLTTLRDLMASSSVCEPVIPPNVAVCLAIGLPDTRLTSNQGVQYLAPVVCGSGTYLCEADDHDVFKAVLNRLRTQGCP